MAVITWTVKAEVANGPSFNKATTLNVEAYEKIDVVIPGGETDMEVTVDGSGLQFLAIRVDQPVQLLVGSGAVGLLGVNSLDSLFFTNTGADNATVSILVGRDATP